MHPSPPSRIALLENRLKCDRIRVETMTGIFEVESIRSADGIIVTLAQNKPVFGPAVPPDLVARALTPVDALTPWLDQVVIIGGWAHRLYRFHPLAQRLDYSPSMTLDADVALPGGLKVKGQDIHERLIANGFRAELLGRHKPPATHYQLRAQSGGFYAEFLTPLIGGAYARGGKKSANDPHCWCNFPKTSARGPSTSCPLDGRPFRFGWLSLCRQEAGAGCESRELPGPEGAGA